MFQLFVPARAVIRFISGFFYCKSTLQPSGNRSSGVYFRNAPGLTSGNRAGAISWNLPDVSSGNDQELLLRILQVFCLGAASGYPLAVCCGNPSEVPSENLTGVLS